MRYEIWPNHHEQWDPDNIDPAHDVIEAGTPAQAAEQYLRDGYGCSEDVIVRDQYGAYFTVSVAMEWTARKIAVTTLEELCEP